MSVALTSGAMLIERNEGMLERCLVSGVTGVEFLFGHVVTQFCVMAFQTALVLIFSFLVFGITINGDIVAATILVLKTGFCGMCFGKFWLSLEAMVIWKMERKLIFPLHHHNKYLIFA